MIELLFLAQNFQCGSTAPLATFEVVVTEANGIEHTLKVGESLVVETLQSVHTIPITNASCAIQYPLVEEVTIDTIPSVAGLYDQPAISSYINALEGSESILLYEYGTTNKASADWQDIVVKIDWDYQQEVIYAD